MQPSASDTPFPTFIKDHLNHKMAANPSQVVEVFIAVVRSLASDDNYKTIAGLFDEIPRLKEQIKCEGVELSHVNRDALASSPSMRGRIEQELELYRTQRNRQEEEKAKLPGDTFILTATIKETKRLWRSLIRHRTSFGNSLI